MWEIGWTDEKEKNEWEIQMCAVWLVSVMFVVPGQESYTESTNPNVSIVVWSVKRNQVNEFSK